MGKNTIIYIRMYNNRSKKPWQNTLSKIYERKLHTKYMVIFESTLLHLHLFTMGIIRSTIHPRSVFGLAAVYNAYAHFHSH